MQQAVQAVLDFWFDESTRPFWFAKSDAFDRELKSKFLPTLRQAIAGECSAWRDSIEGRLAEIIVLDQFSRNLFRDTPCAFAQDGMALILAQEVIKLPEFKDLPIDSRNFIMLPFMHSESKKIHEQSVSLFEKYTAKGTYEFELKHKAIIDKFGRYPHRNAILQRVSTPEEIIFLQQPNSSF